MRRGMILLETWFHAEFNVTNFSFCMSSLRTNSASFLGGRLFGKMLETGAYFLTYSCTPLPRLLAGIHQGVRRFFTSCLCQIVTYYPSNKVEFIYLVFICHIVDITNSTLQYVNGVYKMGPVPFFASNTDSIYCNLRIDKIYPSHMFVVSLYAPWECNIRVRSFFCTPSHHIIRF